MKHKTQNASSTEKDGEFIEWGQRNEKIILGKCEAKNEVLLLQKY